MKVAPAIVTPSSATKSLPSDAPGPIGERWRALERSLDRVFGAAGNPLRQLGALGFHLFWVVVVSGIYVYVFYDTSIEGAYRSIAALNEQPLSGLLMRSLHRYASDAFAIVCVLHLLREAVLGRFRGFRWFTWVSGVPTLWLMLITGIVGYWMVWDQLGSWVAVATLETLSWLPGFGASLVRNAIVEQNLSDRLFSLLVFVHIGVSLALLALMWTHVQRLVRPVTSPARVPGWATLAVLVALALVAPAPLHPPADPANLAGALELDWFYLGALVPAARMPGPTWVVAALMTVLLLGLPWIRLPSFKRARRSALPTAPSLEPSAEPAVVDLENCNGCGRCFADCPYGAVVMVARTDGARYFQVQAQVDADLCAACGICAGSCPSATPFRPLTELASGIDLPQRPVDGLRKEVDDALDAQPGAVIVFACRHGAASRTIAGPGLGSVDLLCSAQLPPAFIDYALRRGARGVVIASCPEHDCEYRFGARWTLERIAGRREPRSRTTSNEPRLLVVQAARGEEARLVGAVAAWRAQLSSIRPTDPLRS